MLLVHAFVSHPVLGVSRRLSSPALQRCVHPLWYTGKPPFYLELVDAVVIQTLMMVMAWGRGLSSERWVLCPRPEGARAELVSGRFQA